MKSIPACHRRPSIEWFDFPATLQKVNSAIRPTPNHCSRDPTNRTFACPYRISLRSCLLTNGLTRARF
jgi:hypothetical protein